MQDFEALGRYVTAAEQAQGFAQERRKALDSLVAHISRTTGNFGSGYVATDFDVAEAEELLGRVAQIQDNLLIAVNEANIHAEACGKPKLKLMKLP